MRNRSSRRELRALAGFLLGTTLTTLILSPRVAQAAPPAFRVETMPEERQLVLSIDREDVVFTPSPQGEVIGLPGTTTRPVAPGSPEVPIVRLTVRVDDDFRADLVKVVARKEVSLGSHRLRATTKRTSEGSVIVPDQPVVIQGEGWLRGRRLLYLAVFPVRVMPETEEVVLATRLEIELAGHEEDPQGIAPRPVPWETKVEEILAQQTVDLRLRRLERSIDWPSEAQSQVWSPTFRPTLDGSPVEYLIVTSDAMAPQFQSLADWKTAKGVQAVVRTMEWIEANYPNGVDAAEQLRFFLDDAYRNWGTLWVLLGGDTDVIPVRYGTVSFGLPTPIPTDLYFSCLEGNWNADNDAVFGEGLPPGQQTGGDSADLTPELFVGRATVSTAAQAATYASKVVNYEKAQAVSSLYPASALLLGEELSEFLDGASFCEEVRQRLPAGFRTIRMYENHQDYPPPVLPEMRSAVIDSFNAGFGIIHHVGHGYRNTMSVGSGTLGNSDVDAMANGNRQSVVYAITCSAAAMDFNCIAERFLKNPNGGAVAYIGSSRISFANPEFLALQNEFYELVFQDSVTAVGQAQAWAKVPFVGDATSEVSMRWLLFTVNLLGDPELSIWRRAPNTITATHPATFVLGSPSYSVTAKVGGLNLSGARVALVKSNTPPTSLDAYAIATTPANGIVNLPFNPQYTGGFTVTVTRPGYKPYQSTTPTVNSTSEPFVHFNQVTVNDDNIPPSSGNNNGIPDAGETLEVTIRLRNSGGSTASGVAATLSPLSGGQYLSIGQDTAAYSTLNPGQESNGLNNYVIEFDALAPDAYQPHFQISMTSVQRSWTDSFVIPVRGIELEHYGHVLTDPAPGGNNNGVPEPGEAISYRITARNNGTGRADAVGVTLRVLRRTTMQPDPLVTVTDGSASFGTLLPGVIFTGDPVAFTIGSGAVVSNLLLELSWSDSHAGRGIGLSDLIPPATVPQVLATGHSSSIDLTWTPSPAGDVRGYDIERSTSAAGPYARINGHTAIGSVYQDTGLASLSRYYYRVVARDSSFSASVPSAYLSTTTTPPLAAGWPIETGQESACGVVLDDIDENGDLELVVGSNAMYAWHHDGVEVRDGDANPSTSGVFAIDGQHPAFGFQATPAIADLTSAAGFEIVGVAWRQAKVYVWSRNGVLQPGWPQTIGGDFNWASPAVEDLDLDGDLEIVVASGYQGKIFAWHHDGTEVADGDNDPGTNGVLFLTNTSFLYSSPAVGNIDGDPYPEIVFGTQTGLVYALSRTGAVKSGWPFATGGGITASPAMADLNADNQHEIVIASEVDSVYVLRGNGTRYSGWPQYASVNSTSGHTSSPVVGDLDGDGNLDIIFAANNGHMHAWNRNGQVLPGWTSVLFAQGALTEDATQATPSVADVDSDGFLEVILGAEDKLIYGWNHDGTVLNGFPIATGGEVRGATPVWDLDHDGKMELMAITYDRVVYVWDLDGRVRADRMPWPFFRHDARNTGRFDAAFLSIGVEEPGPAAAFVAPALYPAYPNPFNPITTIRFRVPGESGAARPVRLAVYDIQGRLIRRLVDGPVETGEQAVVWDGRSEQGGRAASGAYFIKYETEGLALTNKLVLLK